MKDIESLLALYVDKKHEYERFLEVVISYFRHEPSLNRETLPIIHSLKWRLKDPEHLRDKILRKQAQGETIDETNLFEKITDFAGVRILHLYQNQFIEVHEFIKKVVDEGDWRFVEQPVANTWDPESEGFFRKLGLRCDRRDSYYTSIHYLVKPNNERSYVCCEIQVRTLFEEIWGEIDHSINYPHPTTSLACKEQIKVLAKFISAGTRLADSIFKTYEEYKSNRERNDGHS